MQPVKDISPWAAKIARQTVVHTLWLGVGVPLGMGVVVAFAQLLIGVSPLDFFFGFVADITPTLAPNLSILLVVGAVFAMVGGLGYRCISMSGTKAPVLALLRSVLRLELRAASLWKAAPKDPSRVRFVNVSYFPPVSFPNRVALFTPAGLSGAAPLLN